MASEWFYAREGQSMGPVSLEELRRLADSGELHRTDLVWTAPMDEWEEAGGFDELFAPVVSTPSPAEPDELIPPSSSTGPSMHDHQAPRADRQYEGTPRDDRQYGGRGRGGYEGRGSGGDYYAPRSQGMPPMVLIGFIITIAGIAICAPVSIIGSILCMIGMPEAKRRQEGVGLAVAGIVIGLIVFVLGVIAIIFLVAMESGGMHGF